MNRIAPLEVVQRLELELELGLELELELELGWKRACERWALLRHR